MLCLLVAVACSASVTDRPSPIEATGPAKGPASPLPSPSQTRCEDAAPPIRATATAPIEDLSQVPGRALFWNEGKLRVLEDGRIRELVAPYWVREAGPSKVTTDGRIVAVLGGSQPGDAHLWESRIATQRLVRLPFPLRTNKDFLAWSPGAQRVHMTSFGGLEAWIVGLDGISHRATFPDHAVYTAAWRTDDDLTVVSAPASNSGWPLADAVLWSWQPPAQPVRFAGPLTLTTWPRWTDDGRLLATMEATTAGRAVVVRGTTARTVLTEHDLRTGPGNCVRELSFAGVSWSPDARTLAVVGRGSGYFAAFVAVDTSSSPVIFTAPVGEATCYIPGHVDWYATTAVVPLLGPDCGPTASSSENAVALVDPATGSVRYVLTSRKGFITLSGAWAVATSPDPKATEFIHLDDGQRVRVPLSRFVDYCCAGP
jgi:hypothetical protein